METVLNMRSLVRTAIALCVAALTVLLPAAAASAKQPKPAAWAKRHHLKGHWRKKDADKDGLKNAREFALKTDPRRADTDRDGLEDADELTAGDDPLDPDTNGDGVKDGAEHAGVVTSFDGTTLTLRQFHGRALTATMDPDADCYTADAADGDDTITDDDSGAGDSTAGDDTDSSGDDEDWVTGDDGDDTGDAAASAGEDVIDLTDGDDDAA